MGCVDKYLFKCKCGYEVELNEGSYLCSDENGETIYIEVKTTTATLNTPFYMSKNEKFFFENNVENNAFLYRVYDFNVDSRHGKVKKITAKELFENYDFDPVSFMVTPKQA